MKHIEFRLTGSGGQGVLMLGVILAEAAINKGYNAIQSQSYGPEARGGASRCEVIISGQDIDFPEVQQPDVLLALTQLAADKYARDLKADAIVIIDDSIELSHDPGTKNIYRLPILVTARDVVRKELTANIVSLAAINQILGLFDQAELLEAILRRVPKGTEILNQRAVDAGIELVQNHAG